MFRTGLVPSDQNLLDKAHQNGLSIGIGEVFAASTLRVRHHAKNIFPLIANACDVHQCPIGVAHAINLAFFIAILEQDLVVVFQGL